MAEQKTQGVARRTGLAGSDAGSLDAASRARELMRPQPVTLAPPEAGRLLAHMAPTRIGRIVESPAGAFAVGAGVYGLFKLDYPETAIAASVVLGCGWAARGIGRLFRRRWARGRVREAPVTQTLRHLATGTAVRVYGVVETGATFISPASKRPAVMAAYRGTVERIPSWTGAKPIHSEVRGVDFDVTLQTSERIRVLVSPPVDFAHGLPLRFSRGRPSTLYARTVPFSTDTGAFCSTDEESLISPGDVVELYGTLDRVVDPDAERAGTRTLPLTAVLRGTPAQPLYVRRVDPENATK